MALVYTHDRFKLEIIIEWVPQSYVQRSNNYILFLICINDWTRGIMKLVDETKLYVVFSSCD